MIMLSSNSRKVLESRYLRRNSKGEIDESPDQLFNRVAKSIAEAESTYGGSQSIDHWHHIFYQMLSQLHFLPNSPTLMNAGIKNGQLSACFVLPIQDDTKAIFKSLNLAALIQKSGGGTGFNFSNVRPANSKVDHLQNVAAGPLGFIQLFDAMTTQIKQAGKRRGANMAILNINHPDIEQFIESKKKEGILSNFNLSVGITDEFMQAVIHKKKWKLYHSISTSNKWVYADALWARIIESAWKTGDPGLVFLDAIEKANPTPAIGKLSSTNPCGEMPLLDYESCNLGSINLSKMINEVSGKSVTNWELLRQTIHHAMRFLDNVITVNQYPAKKLSQMALGNRKVGLGVMGWAEMLIKMRIPYASDRAVALGGVIMSFINKESKLASCQLAEEKGVFPNWKNSIYYPEMRLRNATTTSIAPTGSISIIANTSSSIEPLYALAYKRYILDGESFSEVNEFAMEVLNSHHLSDALRSKIIKEGSVGILEPIPKKVKKILLTANEVSYKYHLAHQQAFQKHTDNAVSKTINLPNTANSGQIAKMYLKAWKLGLKGITVYRDGSKAAQVLQKQKNNHQIHTFQQRCKVCTLP